MRLVIFSLLLSCAVAQAQDNTCLECGPIRPQFDITQADIRVIWYENEDQIVKMLNLSRPVLAVSECVWDEEYSVAACTIHTVKPKFVNDHYTMRLGHELLHAFAGFYHEQEPIHRLTEE